MQPCVSPHFRGNAPTWYNVSKRFARHGLYYVELWGFLFPSFFFFQDFMSYEMLNSVNVFSHVYCDDREVCVYKEHTSIFGTTLPLLTVYDLFMVLLNSACNHMT